MGFLLAAQTDVGTTKRTNQDSYCIREAHSDKGDILMAVICDGMGGLAKGELASATVVKTFAAWFATELGDILSRDRRNEEIVRTWRRIIKEQNQRILEYGKKNHIELGSTLTIILILEDGHYIVGHVGDSRLYAFGNDDVQIITEDQTVVANEIRLGRITPEQALSDPRRNVLLQCIGASRTVEPAFYEGEMDDKTYLLCSDGFRHKISSEEMLALLGPCHLSGEEEMNRRLRQLIDTDMQRRETDNITALLVAREK